LFERCLKEVWKMSSKTFLNPFNNLSNTFQHFVKNLSNTFQTSLKFYWQISKTFQTNQHIGEQYIGAGNVFPKRKGGIRKLFWICLLPNNIIYI
jgi:hypothetical protein